MERFAEESQSRSVPRKHSPFLLLLVHRATKLVSSGNPITIDHRTSGKRERGRVQGEKGDRQIDSKIYSKVSITLPYSLWRASTVNTLKGAGHYYVLNWYTLHEDVRHCELDCYLDCSKIHVQLLEV